jgi:glutamyl/glutaminyl-tRNA synthetase
VVPASPVYRGRLAPSPTGHLHLGHARTFWTAQERARAANGTLILRNDDLDGARCRPEFVTAMLEDLRWFGCSWSEGPDVGGPYAPYDQSRRLDLYRDVFARLRAAGHIYPCTCSRKDVQAALGAPHETAANAPHESGAVHALSAPHGGGAPQADEPLYPGTCRPENLTGAEREKRATWPREGANWRLRVSNGETLSFIDGHFGARSAVTGSEFGDFLVWRKDDVPSYQLACVADDDAMRITEVVRGADLLLSTFRQLLLFRALGLTPPAFYHCPLVTDEHGVRLAKRHDALALRTLRASGRQPEEIRRQWK